MSKRVLLTGVGGFIGAHCLEYFLNHTDWEIIGIDSFRHKGTYRRVEEASKRHVDFISKSNDNRDRFKVYYHDLSAPIDDQLEKLVLNRRLEDGNIVEDKIDYIINMASDSAVERSTKDPRHCLFNNYELVFNMLEFARKIKPEIFFQVSTDEVYGEAKPNQSHGEWDVIMPSNPYAASKAAQEAMAIAYWRTYGVPVVLTNTMNNIGEWQDSEKFLPKIIQKVYKGEEVPIYADNPKNIGTRYYMHAKNHADAFVFLSQFPPSSYEEGGERPDRYNICGDIELNNLEMAQTIAKCMGKDLKYKLIKSESARKGYDRRYALDGSKMKEKGWNPPYSFDSSIDSIVDWTLENPHWI